MPSSLTSNKYQSSVCPSIFAVVPIFVPAGVLFVNGCGLFFVSVYVIFGASPDELGLSPLVDPGLLPLPVDPGLLPPPVDPGLLPLLVDPGLLPLSAFCGSDGFPSIIGTAFPPIVISDGVPSPFVL